MTRSEVEALVSECVAVVDSALGVNVAVELRAGLACKVFDMLAIEKTGLKSGRSDLPKMEINELMALINPATHPERIAVFGFHFAEAGTDDFSAADIEGMYRKSKQSLPKNLSDVVSSAIKRGWIVESGRASDSGAKTLRLTQMGREFVESRINQAKGGAANG